MMGGIWDIRAVDHRGTGSCRGGRVAGSARRGCKNEGASWYEDVATPQRLHRPLAPPCPSRATRGATGSSPPTPPSSAAPQRRPPPNQPSPTAAPSYCCGTGRASRPRVASLPPPSHAPHPARRAVLCVTRTRAEGGACRIPGNGSWKRHEGPAAAGARAAPPGERDRADHRAHACQAFVKFATARGPKCAQR